MNDQEAWIFAALVLGFAVVYFFPTVVAFSRRHRNRAAILTLNLLLGWTMLGWIGALVWSMTANTERQ